MHPLRLARLLLLLVAVPARAADPTAGRAVYLETCAVCHGPDGRGVPAQIPPLAGSDFLRADRRRAVDVVLRGLSGPVTVNGQRYVSAMPSFDFLTDADVAGLLTFVLGTWDNGGGPVTAADVAAARGASASASTTGTPPGVHACREGGHCP